MKTGSAGRHIEMETVNPSQTSGDSRPGWPGLAQLSLASLAGFLLLVVYQSWNPALDGDWIVTAAGWRRPGLTGFMQAMSWLGSGGAEFPFVLLFVAFLVWRARKRAAAEYFGWCLAGWAMYALLKTVIHRPRPHLVERLSGGGWYSFPSGHAMLGPIIYVFAVVLILPMITRRSQRILLLTAAWLLVFLIAFSRVYLGVHYPSDVAGGILAGASWLGLSLIMIRRRQARGRSAA